MAGPARRRPDVDKARRPIVRETVADENDPDEGHQRKQALVGPFSDTRDHGRALRPQGDEGVGAEESGKPDDHDRKAHAASQPNRRSTMPFSPALVSPHKRAKGVFTGTDLAAVVPAQAGTHNHQGFGYRWRCHIALLRRMGPRLRGDDSGEALLHLFLRGDERKVIISSSGSRTRRLP